jgi:hypothetical protein
VRPLQVAEGREEVAHGVEAIAALAAIVSSLFAPLSLSPSSCTGVLLSAQWAWACVLVNRSHRERERGMSV